MPDRVWYRSLYWRIASGFIALLAVLLVTQGILFLWLTDRIVGPSSRTPAQLAATVADDLGRTLSASPDLDVEAYVPERFGSIYQPFVVAMADGRTASNRPTALPPNLRRAAANRARDLGDVAEERPGRERRFAEFVPILVNGGQVGVVAVPTNPPPVFVALRELGPTLTWFALGLLVAGATIAALVIFRPAHQRLRALEQAARALGEGRTDVRAIEAGGDEVSALASTFNRMAGDLAVRAAALAASDRARRQLLADVSHELMTPLTAIRGYTETLAMPDLGADDDTRRRYLRIIGDETQKLESMIGDLLDLARLEGGGGTIVPRDVAVGDLFGRVLDRHAPAVRDRGLEMQAQADPSLTVSGDPERLEQALQNLAANAIRHTPSGGRIELAGRRTNGEVVLSVRDTGAGIPDADLARVFDRFYKVDPSRTSEGVQTGSGLGLSIVRAIVQRHGGSVAATNVPDGGAVFEIRLPAPSHQPVDSDAQHEAERRAP